MAPVTSATLLRLLLLPLLLWHSTPASAKWQTLSGLAPVIIANGGLSGMYPDQTSQAYYYALYNSLPGVVLSCDLQMAPSLDSRFAASGQGLCRTGLDLSNSTTIMSSAPQLNTTRIVNGQNVTGFFAVDILFENLTTLAYASQSNTARSPAFDGLYPILDPTLVPQIITEALAPASTWWLNNEYTRFTEANSKLNTTLYFLSVINSLPPAYVSVPEIGLLKQVLSAGPFPKTKLIYKFLETQTGDLSTNQTYTELLKNLTYIKTLASGILVPKSYIWSVDPNTLYLQQPSTLVTDAHKVGLEVYAYGFANDAYLQSYNYTFDPITEILYFTDTYNFSVDGIFTDFPVTASEALSCYASSSRITAPQNKQAIVQKRTVISHNGNSGKFPGATSPAYYSAIDAGVDYIDCVVQISADSIPFCRPTVNLVDSTDVSLNPTFNLLLRQYQGLYGDQPGIFTFDLTWGQIATLRATMYSPEPQLPRNPNYDGEFDIITLAEFLSIAKNNSIGALIAIQNAVYIRDAQNLAVVDVVVDVLSAAGYESTDRVILQSDDSAALVRLRELNVTYPLMYEVLYDDSSPISLNANDFVEIKKYASLVNINKRLLEPFDSNFYLIKPPLDLIALAHSQNLTTYFEVQQNEFISMAFDLEDDPTLELAYLESMGVDGFVTDFPTTVQNYLGNQCRGTGLTSSSLNYTIPQIVPGFVGNSTATAPSPASAPAPLLVVPEAPLLGLSLAPSPAPVAIPAAASRISTHFLLAAVNIILYVLVVV